jgi:hypothetical protein
MAGERGQLVFPAFPYGPDEELSREIYVVFPEPTKSAASYENT